MFIPRSEMDFGKQAYYASWYGKLFSDKEHNMIGVRTVLQRAWNMDSIKISKIKNIFHVFFTSEDDLRNIIE